MYILTLLTNKNETVILSYDTWAEAAAMRQAFMLMGDYSNGSVAFEGGHNTPEQNEAFRKAFDATNALWKATK